MESIIGRTILGYTVKEKIGTGGFGDVYKVERNNLVGTVTRALKVITLPKENQYMEVLNSMGGDYKRADEYFRKELDRVVNEIRVFSMISEKDNHNIVSYYENDVEKSGKYRYNIYILMELMTPLDQWLYHNNLTVEEGINIGIDIANALKICHENNIIHRDIKLNNIFVSRDGKFKLGDFGVSKKLDTLTRAHTIKGTPHYIAPEIYMGNVKYNNSVDIYSLGILMYYLFNKRRYPFYPDYPVNYTVEDEDKAFYKRMQYEHATAPVCAPKGVTEIIAKAMEKPECRYSSIEEMIEDLERVRESLTKEALDTEIGFEPKNGSRNVKRLEKQMRMLNELNETGAKSVSFGEHSIQTISKERSKSRYRKFATLLLLCLLVVFLIVFRNYGSKDKTVSMKIEEPKVSTDINSNPLSTKNGADTTSMSDMKEKATNQSIIVIGSYKNKRYKKIIENLKNEGLKVRRKSAYSDVIKKGRIITQSIMEGTKVTNGTTIVLTVSKGKKVKVNDATENVTTPKQQIPSQMPKVRESQTSTVREPKTSAGREQKAFDFDDIVE